MTIEMTAEFWRWYEERRREFDFSDRKVAQKAGIAHSVISKARSGERPISFDALVKIATDAFDDDPVPVLQLAGLLPKRKKLEPDPEWMALIEGEPSETIREWKAAIKAMREERRRRKK